MRCLRILAQLSVGVITLAVAVIPESGGAFQATPAASGDARQSTAILVSATSELFRVAGSDGADHIEYDLVITNAFATPATLTSIEVLTPEGESLLLLEGDAVVQQTQPLLGLTPTAEIPASGTVAVVMDVIVSLDQVVEQLTHRIVYDLAPDDPFRTAVGSFEIEGPALTVNPFAPIVLSPPLRGDGWYSVNSCCLASSIHRSIRFVENGERITKSETFAINWIQVQDGKLFEGDGASPDQWFGFGAEVLAVADGTVVSVRNDMPEEAPGQPVQNVKQPGDYGGNHVMVEIAPGVYAFYGHLQTGSVSVAVGDTVTAGQSIALLGNTGNTTAPHLHFGLLNYPDPIVGNSLPMEFNHYTLVGQVDPESLEAMETDLEARIAVLGEPQEQTDTLQLAQTIANYP